MFAYRRHLEKIMNLHYCLGWPLGSLMASLGVRTVIRIEVIRDDEAGVFIGTSRDLRGLVVEAESVEGVLSEARMVIPDLFQNSVRNDAVACVQYRGRVAHA